jgi:hypothetical protein
MFADSLNLLPRLCLDRLYMTHCFRYYLTENYRWRCDFATAEFVIYNEPEDPSTRQLYRFPMVLLGTQSSISDTFKFVYQHFEGGDRKRVDGKAVKVNGTVWQDHPSLARFGDQMMARAEEVAMYELCTAPIMITPDVMPGSVRGRRGGEGWIVIEDEPTAEEKEKKEKEVKEAVMVEEVKPQAKLSLTPGGLVRVVSTLNGTTIAAATQTLFPERHFVTYNFAVDAEASGHAYILIENPFRVIGAEAKEVVVEMDEKAPILNNNNNNKNNNNNNNNSSSSNNNDATDSPANSNVSPAPFVGWPSPLPPMTKAILRIALETALDHFYDILPDHKEAVKLMLASPYCPPNAIPHVERNGIEEGEEVFVIGDCFQVVFAAAHPRHRILRLEPFGTMS